MAQLGLKIPHLDPQMPNIGPALAQLTRKETIKKISLERGPQGERGPRARARSQKMKAIHARARTPFTPRTPFKGNCVHCIIRILMMRSGSPRDLHGTPPHRDPHQAKLEHCKVFKRDKEAAITLAPLHAPS